MTLNKDSMFVTTAFNDNEQKNTEQLKKRNKNQEMFLFWFVFTRETVFMPRPFFSDVSLDEKLKCRAAVFQVAGRIIVRNLTNFILSAHPD